MQYHVAMARIWGLLALRMSSADVLPVSLSAQAKAIQEYVGVVEELVQPKDKDSADEHEHEHLADSDMASKVDLSPLHKAADAFTEATRKFHNQLNEMVSRSSSQGAASGALQVDTDGVVSVASRTMLRHVGGQGRTDMKTLTAMNDKLAFTERRFLAEEGLHKRKWFRHVLQSPGLYLGYAADVFPGVTQAIRDGDAAVAKSEVEKAARCIQAAADFVDA
jgi:N-acetylated-alpha-linked acidic dipeptidase